MKIEKFQQELLDMAKEKGSFRIGHGTPRAGKNIVQQYNLFESYVREYVGKDVLIQIMDCAEKQENEELKKRVKWLSERLINKYGENENLDYHISAREL